MSQDIELRFPDGASSVGAVSAVGGCSVDPPPIACAPEDSACASGSCACDVAVQILPLMAGGTCHIEVTSATGASYKVDVPLKVVGGACGPEGVGPTDPNQSQITVVFSSDGGVADGAIDGRAD